MRAFSSARVRSRSGAAAFSLDARGLGWSDGLPVIPPTDELVAVYLEAVDRPADEVLAVLPPDLAACTVEKVAINACMTAMPPLAMSLVCAGIQAMGKADFSIGGVNATTAPVSPALIANGPIRHELEISMAESCLGGAEGSAASIGRAIRLIMRNVAGQRPGVTTESVFGQPARIVSVVVSEWEERSPWPPLAARRGIFGDAVTVFPMMGTMNVADTIADSALAVVEMLGRSAAYIGANGFLAATDRAQMMFAINPVWAQLLAQRFSVAEDLQEALWDQASLPISVYPETYRQGIEDLGRVDRNGRVHAARSPEDFLLVVCGGLAALHSTILPGFTSSLAVTLPVTT